jgi:long-chain fatty acid transport protein
LGLLLLLVGAPRPTRAGGFLIYDLTGEAVGRASAVTASTVEPGAVLYNPAALAIMPGYQLSLGGTAVVAQSHFDGGETALPVDSGVGRFFLPGFFATARVHDRIGVGLGGFTAFGLGAEWPKGWVGRRYAIAASLQSFTINPTAAFRLLPGLSVGVGVQAVKGTVDFTNGLPDLVGGGTVRIGGGAWGFGGNVGVLYQAVPDKVHAALTYRSRVKLAAAGRADFQPAAPEFQQQLLDQDFKATITLPDIITAAFMYRPLKNLELELDVNVTMWSTYDSILIDFESAPDETLYRKNKTAPTFRLGAELALPIEGVSARCGVVYDVSPAPKEYVTPAPPEASRIDVALGLGYRHRRFNIDVGYMAVYFLGAESRPAAGQEHIVGPTGSYHTIAHLFSATLTMKLGMPPTRPVAAAAPAAGPAAAPTPTLE